MLDTTQAVARWEKENLDLAELMRSYKGDEYKTGFADGLETAVDWLRTYLDTAD
ncbi:MAG: hypothetical protein H0Z39_09840 [Peptococcaceae bacterium]|nr:hypothetical protein [Peptococcaceae bacterium]